MKNLELSANELEYTSSLRAWISEIFGTYSDFQKFVDAFNTYFQIYQHDVHKKMLLSEIAKGEISCSMAALITGMWWQKISQLEPTFIVDREEAGYLRRSELHVLVALPLLNSMTANYGSAKGQLLNSESFIIADYVYTEQKEKMRKNGLRQTPLHRFPVHYEKMPTITSFLKDRFQVFNYSPEYPVPPAEFSSSLSTHSLQSERPKK